jgi:ubiquinone/menaquinone biosynthesis C-methylase UbiE
MGDETGARHERLIVEQFTRQAVPFSQMPGHSAAFDVIWKAVGPREDDLALDVACGPGLVACALAPQVRHVTGIDITPAMIEQARLLQAEKNLANLTWLVGNAAPLPFEDAAFSLVLTRYSFHHFLEPAAVLAEMCRVCRPRGRVAVIDVFTSSPAQAARYDALERLRDPSHTHALELGELSAIMLGAGLEGITTDFYRLDMEVEPLLAASCPNPGDKDKARRIYEEDLGRDELGLNVRREGGGLHFSFPIVVMAGSRPA